MFCSTKFSLIVLVLLLQLFWFLTSWRGKLIILMSDACSLSFTSFMFSFYHFHLLCILGKLLRLIWSLFSVPFKNVYWQIEACKLQTCLLSNELSIILYLWFLLAFSHSFLVSLQYVQKRTCWLHTYIQSYSNYLLSICYVTGTGPCTCDITVHRSDKKLLPV